MSFRRIVTFGAIGIALAACLFYKPLRVLAPQAFGFTCISNDLCLENSSDSEEARRLRDEALQFVTTNVGPIKETPRVIFCRSKTCFARFGNPAVAAFYYWGIETLVINETGWHDYILRHELIHHWQAEEFGPFRAARLPDWYIEGMAYTLSQDPRDPLPREDIEEWRARFNRWVADGNKWQKPPQ